MTQRLWLILFVLHLVGLAVIFGRDGLMMSPDVPHRAADEARRNPFMLAQVGVPVAQAAAEIVIEWRFGDCVLIETRGLVTFGRRIDPAGDKVRRLTASEFH